MARALHVYVASALLLAGTLICGTEEEPAPLAFECRVVDAGDIFANFLFVPYAGASIGWAENKR
jgi:hypothetical protein